MFKVFLAHFLVDIKYYVGFSFDGPASTNYLEVWHKILTIDRAIKHFARSIVQRRTVLISMAVKATAPEAFSASLFRRGNPPYHLHARTYACIPSCKVGIHI